MPKIKIMKNQKRTVFSNTCSHCNQESINPICSDFEYGYFIFQTVDGKCFGYVDLFDLSIWEDSFKSISEKYFSPSETFSILSISSDGIENVSIANQYPLCSNCAEPLEIFGTERQVGSQEIPEITFEAFSILPLNEKVEFLQEAKRNAWKKLSIKEYANEYLVKKFLKNWHLSTMENNWTKSNPLYGSTLIEEMEKTLIAENRYPNMFDEDTGFDGALAILSENKVDVIWKVEAGVGRFEEIKREEKLKINEGLKKVGNTLWGNSFDGTNINWKK